ncbi:hypothetical protein U9M48_031360 [Paspalum notatum var. saurae]|uniref:Uncharacterized protein n=1 Tax=Paspalum notatum var. saurae TaxID=547442 RepID=A0AAQ3X3B3_PASNO
MESRGVSASDSARPFAPTRPRLCNRSIVHPARPPRADPARLHCGTAPAASPSPRLRCESPSLHLRRHAIALQPDASCHHRTTSPLPPSRCPVPPPSNPAYARPSRCVPPQQRTLDGALPPSPTSPCAPTRRLLAPPPLVKQVTLTYPSSSSLQSPLPTPLGVRCDGLQVLDEALTGMDQGRTDRLKRAHGATEFAAGRHHRHVIKMQMPMHPTELEAASICFLLAMKLRFDDINLLEQHEIFATLETVHLLPDDLITID